MVKDKMTQVQVDASHNGRYLTVDKAIELLLDYKKKYRKLLKLAGEVETKIDDNCDFR